MKPEDLKEGDKIGPYLNFVNQVEGGYQFYETCGLGFVTLHWQTVNWLLENLR